MKVEVVDVSPVEKRVEVEVESEQVADEIEEQYSEFQGKAQVKGFRPGKVPRKLLERLFKDYVMEAVVQKLVKETLEPALSRKSLTPVVEPVLDPGKVVAGEPFKYTLHVEVKPEFTLSDYKGLEVAHAEAQVGTEDEAKALLALRESVAILKDPEPSRPIRKDDQVVAEVLAKEGDQEISMGKDKEQVIELWRPSWIPGLSDQLTGRSVGDEVKYTAQVPEDDTAPPSYRGKKLDLTIKITGHKERILAELTDQFAKDYTRHETLEDLKKNIREGLEKRTERSNRGRLENAILETLIRKNPLAVPPSLAKQEALALARDFIQGNFRKKPTNEEAERFVEIFMGEAKQSLMAHYLLEAVAKQEGIEASTEEVEKEITEEAGRAGVHPEKFRARLTEAQVEATKWVVLMKKALDFLILNANIKAEAAAAAGAETKEEEKGKA